MIVLGLGLGMSFVPATVAATSGVASHQAGIASGLVNTSRQVGGAIGLAALSTVAATGLGDHPGLSAVATGDRNALYGAAGLAALGALVALLIGPVGRREKEATDV
ncbi:MAG: hypothetical protein INR71_13030 [Terriglobus roseus]|nr:hypothetical protein [Terriglobus roseus]